MVKGHLTGCGLHGYSLVSISLIGQSNKVLFYLFQVFVFACFVVCAYYSSAVEETVEETDYTE